MSEGLARGMGQECRLHWADPCPQQALMGALLLARNIGNPPSLFRSAGEGGCPCKRVYEVRGPAKKAQEGG